eukprot:superscaffoldBa00014198_g26274
MCLNNSQAPRLPLALKLNRPPLDCQLRRPWMNPPPLLKYMCFFRNYQMTKILTDQAKHFADIRKDVSEMKIAVEAIEAKLADMLTRMTSMEVRLDMLEEAKRQRCDSPLALASEVDKLNAKLTEYEDRERTTLPEILQADFQGGLDLEHAHRYYQLSPEPPLDPSSCVS